MKVRELMTKPPLTVRDTDDVALGLQVLAWGEIRHLPVLRDGIVVGVVSERDLLGHQRENPKIGQVMTAKLEVASPEDDVGEAAQRMIEARIGCLPVLEHGHLVGIVTVTDVVAMHGAPTKNLMAPVRQAMTPDPVTVSPDDFLVDAIRRTASRQVRHAPVVDAHLHVVGMLSDRDIRLALGTTLLGVTNGGASAKMRLLKVRDAMTRDPVVVHEWRPISEAAHAFVKKTLGALPVVDDEARLVGILSYVDVLRAVLEATAPAAERRAPPPPA